MTASPGKSSNGRTLKPLRSTEVIYYYIIIYWIRLALSRNLIEDSRFTRFTHGLIHMVSGYHPQSDTFLNAGPITRVHNINPAVQPESRLHPYPDFSSHFSIYQSVVLSVFWGGVLSQSYQCSLTQFRQVWLCSGVPRLTVNLGHKLTEQYLGQ